MQSETECTTYNTETVLKELSAELCAQRCQYTSSMFTYQRNNSGQCTEDGCDCVCDSKAETNGNCVTRSSSKNDLFRFSTGIPYCCSSE